VDVHARETNVVPTNEDEKEEYRVLVVFDG
jgi:hypothetical protein